MKLCVLCVLAATAVGFQRSDDQQLVYKHVRDHANDTFRPAKGVLKYPYLVPAGPYDQLWDWDSMFTGLALLPFGSAPYFEGSMLNFLANVNVSSGDVEGCLLPSGGTGTIFHAKPVILQGALLAAKHTGGFGKFRAFASQMESMLAYWSRPLNGRGAGRLDPGTGLRVWYNQLESGEDNLVLSTCPSSLSPDCWVEADDALAISAVDVMSFLYREQLAYAAFNDKWAAAETDPAAAAALRHTAATWRSSARDVARATGRLWDASSRTFVAYNVTAAASVKNRVGLMGFPLWAGIATPAQAAEVRAILSHVSTLLQGDAEPPHDEPCAPWHAPATPCSHAARDCAHAGLLAMHIEPCLGTSWRFVDE